MSNCFLTGTHPHRENDNNFCRESMFGVCSQKVKLSAPVQLSMFLRRSWNADKHKPLSRIVVLQ